MTAQSRLFATGGFLSAALVAIGVLSAGTGVHATGDEATTEAGSASATSGALSKSEFREQLMEILKEEPEIVIQAIELYQLREEQRRQDQIAQALPQFIPQIENLVERGERVLVQGNPKGDVTLIEFADYNCGVCRRVQPEIQAFLAADPNVRHVVKALAYIGSPYPELAIVAAAQQGNDAKVAAFHRAMMASEERLTNEKVLEIAGSVGLDTGRIAADVESEAVAQRVQRTIGVARALDIQGTPALIFPDRITSFVTSDEMTAIAADVRGSR